jgi:Cytochrome P450
MSALSKPSAPSKPSSPPGPRGHWLLGNLAAMQHDMPGLLRRVAREYGGVSRIRVGPTWMYLIADGEIIVDLLTHRAAELRKSNRTRWGLAGHLGDGLITLEGAQHRRHRRLVQPVMHTRSIAAQADTMAALTEARVAAWADGSTVDILAEMQDLTLRIVCAALFHVDTPDQTERFVAAVHDFAVSLNVVLRRAFPIPGWLPTSGNRLRSRTVSAVDALAYDLIRRRRAAPGEDLLSLLVLATDADGEPALSDVEIRDELMTMFFAGHESSASALAWALYLLAEHPDIAEQVRAEVAALGVERVSLADLARLPLLGRVVAETLRMYPPAWVFDRSPLTDLTVGGYRIPKGANVLLSPWVVHRDPRVWDDPDTFRPDRFATAEAPPRTAYLPFGDGPRMCVGNRFAEAEIRIVLATLLPRVELSLEKGQTVRPEGDATLRPRGGLRMVVRRR